MAVSTETLQRAEDTDVKGKAVFVLHTWRDALWETGTEKAADVPEPSPLGNRQRSQGEGRFIEESPEPAQTAGQPETSATRRILEEVEDAESDHGDARGASPAQLQ